MSHREKRLTVVRRNDAAWMTSDARAGETVALDSMGVAITVGDVYRGGLEDVRVSG